MRVWIGLLAAVALTAGTVETRAAEIMPWLGVSRAVDGNGEAKPSGGLAVRGSLLPVLQAEVAVGFRTESRAQDQVTVRSWPITGSLYVTPVRPLYVGAGAGWYQTSFSYDDALPYEDQTRQEFGIHLGGGLRVPVSSAASVDLGGRYVMMRDQESELIPEKFDADFWMTTLGVAFRF